MTSQPKAWIRGKTKSGIHSSRSLYPKPTKIFSPASLRASSGELSACGAPNYRRARISGVRLCGTRFGTCFAGNAEDSTLFGCVLWLLRVELSGALRRRQGVVLETVTDVL